MDKPEFSGEELLSSLGDLHLRDQISVLEAAISEHHLTNDVADVLALCMMTVLLDVDESCPPDLRQRLDVLSERIRRFNVERFVSEPPYDATR
jgi:hypothetical protein